MPIGEIATAGKEAVKTIGETVVTTAGEIGDAGIGAKEVAISAAQEVTSGAAAAAAAPELSGPLTASPARVRALEAAPAPDTAVVTGGSSNFGNDAGSEGTVGPHGPKDKDQIFVTMDFTENDAARMTDEFEKKNPGLTIVNGTVVSKSDLVNGGARRVETAEIAGPSASSATVDSRPPAEGSGNFNPDEEFSAPIGKKSGAELNAADAAAKEEFGPDASVDFSGTVGNGAVSGVGEAGGPGDAGDGSSDVPGDGAQNGEVGVAASAASTATVESSPKAAENGDGNEGHGNGGSGQGADGQGDRGNATQYTWGGDGKTSNAVTVGDGEGNTAQVGEEVQAEQVTVDGEPSDSAANSTFSDASGYHIDDVDGDVFAFGDGVQVETPDGPSDSTDSGPDGSGAGDGGAAGKSAEDLDAETARLTEYYKEQAEKFQAEQDAALRDTYGRPEDVQAELRKAQQEAVQASLDAMNSLNQAYESGHPDAIAAAEAAGAEADRQFAEAMHNFDPENRVVDSYGTPIDRDAAPVGDLVDGTQVDAWQRDLVAEPADGVPDESTPGDGVADVLIKPAPAVAQAQARTHPADVRENENVAAGWKPARTGDGLVGPTGEKIAVAPGDGTTPVVLGDRVYYDNGDPWTGPGRQVQREAAAAAVDAVNYTAGEGTNGVLSSENTAVVGQVMIADAGTPQAEVSANVPEYRQALVQMHGDQVGPTVLEHVTVNPDGSLNSAVMHTTHRQPDGTVRTIASAFEDGRIYTPLDTNYPQNSDAPSLGALTNDNVFSDGEHGIVVGAVGSSAAAPVVTDYPFTGEVTPAQARVLRRYEQAEGAVPPPRIRIVDFVPDQPNGGKDNGKPKVVPDSDQGKPKAKGAAGQAEPEAATGGSAGAKTKARTADGPKAGGEDAEATARTEDKGTGEAGQQKANGKAGGKEKARAADGSGAEGGDGSDTSGKTRAEDKSQAKSEPKAEEKEDTRTFYEVLGIKKKPRKVTKADIKRAYRERARQTHPDEGENANPEEFRKVSEAYETLIKPASKRAYDIQEAAKRVYERVTLRKRASANGTPDVPDGMRYPVGELGWDKAVSPNAWAFANLFDFVREADGGKQLVVDPGLFGFNNEVFRCVLRALPHGAQKSDVISLRIYHIDSATQKPVGASEALRMIRASDGKVTVQTSQDFGALVGNDRLNGTGSRSANPDQVQAAVETISQALILDPLDVATVKATTIFQSAQTTAAATGSSVGGDLSNPNPDKDPDKGDKDTSGKKKAPDKKEDDDPLQKPLWELTDEQRRQVLQQIVDDRLGALRRERKVKDKRSGNLKVRSNETLKEATNRKRKEDEQWADTQQRRLELEGLREMLNDLKYARYMQNQQPSTPLRVQMQQRKAIKHVEREVLDQMDKIIEIDWAKAQGKPVKGIDVAHTFKEPRLRISAKARGKAGNAHKRYSKQELKAMKDNDWRHPNRPPKRSGDTGPEGRGPVRNKKGKRKLLPKEELKQRTRNYREAKSRYLELKAAQKNLHARKKALREHPLKNSKEISAVNASLKSVNYGIRMAARDMRGNGAKSMALRAAGRSLANQVGK